MSDWRTNRRTKKPFRMVTGKMIAEGKIVIQAPDCPDCGIHEMHCESCSNPTDGDSLCRACREVGIEVDEDGNLIGECGCQDCGCRSEVECANRGHRCCYSLGQVECGP